MKWNDGDDLGIDIIYYTHNTQINIDVKSTHDEYLKISKNRKETDFYAICKWDKQDVILLGFLFKYNFWKSTVINTEEPEKIKEMYRKKLTKKFLSDNVVDIKELFSITNNYKLKKMKKAASLFSQE